MSLVRKQGAGLDSWFQVGGFTFTDIRCSAADFHRNNPAVTDRRPTVVLLPCSANISPENSAMRVSSTSSLNLDHQASAESPQTFASKQLADNNCMIDGNL
jgi:hypothetical protein